MQIDECFAQGGELVAREDFVWDRVIERVEDAACEYALDSVAEPLARDAFGLGVDGEEGLLVAGVGKE